MLSGAARPELAMAAVYGIQEEMTCRLDAAARTLAGVPPQEAIRTCL
jgi:hypothetical protein